MCAIWLLGTRAPLEFLTTLGEASAAPFGATAVVSMVEAGELLRREDVVRRSSTPHGAAHASKHAGRSR